MSLLSYCSRAWQFALNQTSRHKDKYFPRKKPSAFVFKCVHHILYISFFPSAITPKSNFCQSLDERESTYLGSFTLQKALSPAPMSFILAVCFLRGMELQRQLQTFANNSFLFLLVLFTVLSKRGIWKKQLSCKCWQLLFDLSDKLYLN